MKYAYYLLFIVNMSSLCALQQKAAPGSTISQKKNVRPFTAGFIIKGMLPKLPSYLAYCAIPVNRKFLETVDKHDASLQYEKMDTLIKKVTNTNVCDLHGDTLAHKIIKKENYSSEEKVKALEYLLEKKATINKPDKDDKTLLQLALKQNNLHLTEHLITKGAQPRSFAEFVEMFSTANIDPEKPSELLGLLVKSFHESIRGPRVGETLLHYYAKLGDVQAIQTLVQLGAKKSQDNLGRLPEDFALAACGFTSPMYSQIRNFLNPEVINLCEHDKIGPVAHKDGAAFSYSALNNNKNSASEEPYEQISIGVSQQNTMSVDNLARTMFAMHKIRESLKLSKTINPESGKRITFQNSSFERTDLKNGFKEIYQSQSSHYTLQQNASSRDVLLITNTQHGSKNLLVCASVYPAFQICIRHAGFSNKTDEEKSIFFEKKAQEFLEKILEEHLSSGDIQKKPVVELGNVSEDKTFPVESESLQQIKKPLQEQKRPEHDEQNNSSKVEPLLIPLEDNSNLATISDH